MDIDLFLSKLARVRKTGANSWIACCPAHDDESPSLSIRETEDGRILIHCFAQCSVHEVVEAAGIRLADLFPSDHKLTHCRPERRPFPAADILRAVAFEALIVASTGASMLAGHPISTTDRDRLIVAVSRIQAALTAGGLNHG